MERSDAMLRCLAAVAAAALALPGAAAEQPFPYRKGLPKSAVPEETALPTADAAAAASFARWNTQSGRPRFVVYWERELTSDIDLPDGDALDIHERDVGKGTLTTLVVRKRDAPVPTMRAPRIPEREAWQIETSFTDAMARAGARLVDRATAIRLRNLTDKEARTQALEMSALSEHADVLCELLPTHDARALMGFGFRVSCKDVRTGAVLASTYATGGSARRESDRPTVSGWVPPERPDTAHRNPVRVGRQLAQTLMAELAQHKP